MSFVEPGSWASRHSSQTWEALAFAEQAGYRAVLKSKRLQSSIGVFVAETLEALASRFADTVRHSQDGRILVERFVAGPEIAVEGFSLRGAFHVRRSVSLVPATGRSRI